MRKRTMLAMVRASCPPEAIQRQLFNTAFRCGSPPSAYVDKRGSCTWNCSLHAAARRACWMAEPHETLSLDDCRIE